MRIEQECGRGACMWSTFKMSSAASLPQSSRLGILVEKSFGMDVSKEEYLNGAQKILKMVFGSALQSDNSFNSPVNANLSIMHIEIHIAGTY